jgi:hypothetical protein
MHFRLLIPLVAMFASARCNNSVDLRPLPAERKTAVESAVRSFVLNVAHDVTSEGPTAWQKEFADDPAFFMAVDGHLVFPNRQIATQAIQDLPRMIKHIELRWGDDLRIDPLTESLAVVAASYHEVQTSPEGHQLTEDGFFTAVAEYRDGRWQFRDTHWSDPIPPSPVSAAKAQ